MYNSWVLDSSVINTTLIWGLRTEWKLFIVNLRYIQWSSIILKSQILKWEKEILYWLCTVHTAGFAMKLITVLKPDGPECETWNLQSASVRPAASQGVYCLMLVAMATSQSTSGRLEWAWRPGLSFMVSVHQRDQDPWSGSSECSYRFFEVWQKITIERSKFVVKWTWQ